MSAALSMRDLGVLAARPERRVVLGETSLFRVGQELKDRLRFR